MALALRERGSAGQPEPIVPSSLYCAVTEGRLRDLRVLVISYDASVFVWGAIIRESRSADSEGSAVAGGFREGHNFKVVGRRFSFATGPVDRVSSLELRTACWRSSCAELVRNLEQRNYERLAGADVLP